MNQGRIAEAGTFTLIHRSLVGLAALTTLCFVALGARAVLLQMQFAQAIEQTKADKRAIKEARPMIEKGAGLNLSSNKAGLSDVSAFQTLLVENTRLSGCLVRDLVISSEPQPYLTRFKLDTPPTEFVQLTFKAVILGTPASIVAVLDSLAQSSIPFEYDSVTIRRDRVQGSETTIEATIELRVLTKVGGA